jgi:hypothetical protein
MRVPSLISTALLLTAASGSSLALTPVIHTTHTKAHVSTQHASIKHATAHTPATVHKSVHTAAAAPHREAVGISNERATEIQTALIQHGYLTGDPSGTWDAETIAAMTKLQADNGWGTKVTPDARALIKLGLGPQQPATTTQAPPQQ